MHYYQHHIGDFIKATSCLSNDQMVSYLRLLWMYYDSENPLEDDPEVLALRSGAKPEDVRLIHRAFFRLEDGVWRQSRCDREIEEYHAICDRNAKNGKLGGRPKKKPSRFPVGSQSVPSGLPVGTQPEPSRNPDETLTSNHEPVTNKPIINTPPMSPKGESFVLPSWVPSEAWDAYMEVRKNIKCANTPRALQALVKRLEELRDAGHNPSAVLEQSTVGSWKSLYEIKGQKSQQKETGDWWTAAGFANQWEAANAQCFEHNAKLFRDGKKQEAA